jgi:hypothetical protein
MIRPATLFESLPLNHALHPQSIGYTVPTEGKLTPSELSLKFHKASTANPRPENTGRRIRSGFGRGGEKAVTFCASLRNSL